MDNVLNRWTLNRLIGPIFDRELRACSRRKRYYLLRMAFIIVMLLLVGWAWMMATAFASMGQSPAFATMRMSIVSRSVVAAVVWMEFLGMPLLAVLMLSDSISQEINKLTLEVLLSTPITSFQIVTGKFFSRLLQLLLLAAVTVPLFAIIRVFGGVPWDYVVAAICLTLTTTCLFGAISLYGSIHIRQSYRVIIWVVLSGILVFGLLPGLTAAIDNYYSHPWLGKSMAMLEFINPFIAMAEITTSVMSSNPQGSSVFNWAGHCAAMGAVSLVIVLLSTIRLRKIMLNLSAGRMGGPSRAKRLWQYLTTRQNTRGADRALIEVCGHPILWKEMRMNESQRLFGSAVRNIAFGGLIAVIFICAAFFEVLTEPVFHTVLVAILSLIGFLRTAMLSALSISKEKQSRAWPILLTTPLDESEILKMKTRAILKKTAIFWIIIAADVLVFSACLVLNPIAIAGVAIAIVPAVLFLIGIGAYFGMRLKTTTGTMVATFLVPVTLWMFCPCTAYFNPLALIGMSVGIGMEEGAWQGVLFMMAVNLIPAVIYGVAGYIFLVRAKSSMRKYAFNTAS